MSPDEAPAESPDNLGPVVLEQKATHATALVMLLLGGLMTPMSLALAFITPPGKAAVSPGQLIIALGSALVMGLLPLGYGLYLLWRDRGLILYLHEHGLRERRRGRESTIRFDDAEELTFQSTRVYVNGVYSGTVERLAVRSSRPEPRSLFFQHKRRETSGMATGYEETGEVGRIANRVASALSRRMAGRLQRGESVAWTPRLRLSRGGIAVSPRQNAWQGGLPQPFKAQTSPHGGKWEVIPWERVAKVDTDQGVFRLWVEGQSRPFVQLPTGLPNFHPGYLVATAILGRRSSDSPTPSPASPTEVPGQGPLLRAGFTWTVEDHIAENDYLAVATPEGRKAWRGRILIPTGIAAGLAFACALMPFLRGELSPSTFAIASGAIVVGTPILGFALKAWARKTDATRIAAEIEAAHERAQEGRGPDPLDEWQVVMGPGGYVIRMSDGQIRRPWSEVERVERFGGYIITVLPEDKVRREQIELTLPSRAFDSDDEARLAFERLVDWHGGYRR